MTEEEWRPVVGYEGLYEVSSFGRVKSLRRGRILTGSISKYGYVRCNIKVNGVLKSYSVHRLVAQAFISNPDNLPEVNHKDEDKTNNRVDNLEWCDRSYNMNYGTRLERCRNTMLEMGHWSGLSKEEYIKKYKEENKEKIRKYFQNYTEKHKDEKREYDHQYYLKKKAGL